MIKLFILNCDWFGKLENCYLGYINFICTEGFCQTYPTKFIFPM